MSSILIVQVQEGGADEFGSVDEWADHMGLHDPDGTRKEMKALVDSMAPGTFVRFGGGWMFKGEDLGPPDVTKMWMKESK